MSILINMLVLKRMYTVNVVIIDDLINIIDLFLMGLNDFRWLRHHPKVLALKFRSSVKRAVMANAIEDFICGHVGN